jgi:hypothetical protein
MNNETRIPGESVDAVNVEDVLRSTGIQLVGWANDIAFTDAAFGEAWAMETANRMAALSEILFLVHKTLTRDSLTMVIKLPVGTVGVMSINPHYKADAEKPPSDDGGDSGKVGGSSDSIDGIPF